MTHSHEIEVYVRFRETDLLGYVNNVSYFIYFEEARTRFFDEVGAGIEQADQFILASVKGDFFSQARTAQRLRIGTRIHKIGTKSLTVVHVLTDKETNQLIAKGTAVLVAFDYNLQQTIAIPQEIRERLERRMVST